MKKLFIILAMWATTMFAQGIPVIGDTTDLKNHTMRQIVILEEFGKGDHTGGGLFRRVDSTFSEGTNAFDYVGQSGLQWVRLQYIGGELGAFTDLTSTSLVVSGTSEFNGAIEVDAGLAYVTQSLVIYAVGGAPQAGTDGANIAADDGDRHFSQIFVPYTTSVTGIFYLVGSVGGTDSVIVDLYDATGTLVTGGSSITSGGDAEVLVGTAAQIQSVPFEDGAITINPGVYFISVTFDGTTAKYAAYEVVGSKFIADTDTGTFGTAASITPGTAYVDSKGPIGGIY